MTQDRAKLECKIESQISDINSLKMEMEVTHISLLHTERDTSLVISTERGRSLEGKIENHRGTNRNDNENKTG